MKFCKDCAHYRATDTSLPDGEYAKCAKGLQVNPVTGDLDLATQSTRYCLNLRQSEMAGDCGPGAKFFMPLALRVAESDMD